MSEVVQTTTDPGRAAAAEACRRAGLSSNGLSLLRHGTNSVYRLPEAGVIVRVAPPKSTPDDVERQVKIARWLAEEHVPAVRALAVAQPQEADGRLVTFWESVNGASADDYDHYGSTAELGNILRQFHALPAPDFSLPVLDPLSEAQSRLGRLAHLPNAARGLFAERLERVAADFPKLRFQLEGGPIHGDANVGNLLLDEAGSAVLSDLDGFSVGPREWDLVLTAMYTDLYGWHTEQEYLAFVESYGWDIRLWSGYHTLRDLRELLMVMWLATRTDQDEDAAQELQVRLGSLETGQGRREWRPI